MKRYMTLKAYAQESGFPLKKLRQLVHCCKADQFCFRRSGAQTAAFYLDVAAFERMLEAGDLEEVMQ